MTFLIRALSQTAAGRPVINEKRVDAASVSIGRDVASDIHLPDLAVTRNHARLTMDGTRRVLAEATDNLPFEVDGRSTERAVIDLAVGGELRFGVFRLGIAAGAGADSKEGDVTVTVERSSDSASIDPLAERARFSLGAVAPSKRWTAWGLAVAILLAFLAWPIYSFNSSARATINNGRSTNGTVADASWSPGKLSLAHAALERNCTACHQKSFVAVKDDNCKSCHATVHDHAPAARLAAAKVQTGFGARMRLAVANTFGRSPGRCVDCHMEHEGAVQMAKTPEKFCADCHADLKEKLTDTRLGDAGDFGKLHPQFRPAVIVTPGEKPVVQRISIDDKPRQSTGLLFPHAEHLSATNSVARMAVSLGQAKPGKGLDCAGCHAPDGDGGFRQVSMENNCQSCHSLAFGKSGGVTRTLRHGLPDQALAELRDYYASHGSSVQPIGSLSGRRRPGDFAASSMHATYGGHGGDATGAVFGKGGLCAECHVIERPGGGFQIAPVSLSKNYLVHGTFDHRAHVSQTCASCHAAAKSNDARDTLLPGIDNCRTCHVGTADAPSGKVPSSCAMCHSYHVLPTTTPRPHPPKGPATQKVAALLPPGRWP